MFIILLVFALIRTLHGVPLSLETPDGFPALDLRDTQNHLGQRGVNDIVISCFATIFACTWTAIHPNIPAPTDCWWTRFKRQIMTMIYALLAPEMITVWALRQRRKARRIADIYNEDLIECTLASAQANTTTIRSFIRNLFRDAPSPPAFKEGEGPQWTLAHGFFLQMGGFMLCENGRPVEKLTDASIIVNIQNENIDPPRLTEEDIQDRSKGDIISKIFIILQTTWFITQCIARWSQRLPVTELEVATLAFAMLNGITYGIWWNKPQNVRRPVFLERKKPQGDPNRTLNIELNTTRNRDQRPSDAKIQKMMPGPRHRKESWLRRRLRDEIEDVEPSAAWNLLWRIPLRVFEAFLRPLGKLMDGDIGELPRPQSLRVAMFFSTEYLDISSFLPSAIATALIGTLVGAVHLIPSWFLDFSSRQEMWLWRVSAIIISIEPLFVGVASYFEQSNREPLATIFPVVMLGGLPFYLISRIVLLSLSLISLRSLSTAALQTIEWTTFIPHL